MILLDTSFIVAYFNERDENHSKSTKFIKDIVDLRFGPLYLTDYIFSETITVSFIRMKNLGSAIKIGKYLLRSLEIIQTDKEEFYEAWKLFQAQKQTRFSFADCITLAVMLQKGIDNIATFDEDFKKVLQINCIGV